MLRVIAGYVAGPGLLVAVILQLAGCGGGGSGNGGSSANIHHFAIYSPVPGGSTYRTSAASVSVRGEGYAAPIQTNCDGMQKLNITWRNSANNTSGTGTSSASCLCVIVVCGPYSSWGINYDLIALELGSNTITVTGAAAGGSRSASITVIREAAVTSSAVAGARSRAATNLELTENLRVTVMRAPGGDGTAVNLHYPAPESAMRVSGEVSNRFDRKRVMSDLAHHVQSGHYDFVLFYSLADWPGWEEPHGPCFAPAHNIGFNNDLRVADHCTDIPAQWTRLRSHLVAPLLENRERGEDLNLKRALHGIGRAWGVYWRGGVDAVNAKVARSDHLPVAAGARHWTAQARWFRDGLPGLMASPPGVARFNAFDLYAMGLMEYEEVVAYEYLLQRSESDTTLVAITVDDLIEQLQARGTSHCNGDGRRVPALDPQAMDLRALLVLLTAGEEAATTNQVAELQRLSAELPEAWNDATWGRSVLTTGVVEQ